MKNENRQTNITDEQWKIIKKLFSDTRTNINRFAFRYYSIATVKKDGTPHVSPFGSVFLTEKNKGIYFETFSPIMAENLKTNKHICVMAVNLNRWYWFKVFFKEKISSPIGIRLNGIAGEKRDATPDDKKALNRLFPKWLKLFKGFNSLLTSLRYVRDIHFTSFDYLSNGEMENGK